MGGGQRNFELSVPQILGSALAAVTAAVAASFLGVAGTVIGAAVMSIGSTVGTAVYTHYLKRTGERVRLRSGSPGREEEASGSGAGGDTLVMPVVETERRRLPWGRVALAAGLVFAVSMGGILVYQAAAHQTVHEQVTGGTTRHKPATPDRRTPSGPAVRASVPAVPVATPEADVTRTPAPTPSATPTVTTTVTATPTAPPAPTATTGQEPAEPQPSATAPPEPEPTAVDEAPEPDHPEAEAQPSTWSR
jgi:hypothetical protein